MTKTTKRDLIKRLSSTGNSHTIIAREAYPNGQQTTESYRYTAVEMAEIFDEAQLAILVEGGVVLRPAIGHAPDIRYVSAEALAQVAFRKAR